MLKKIIIIIIMVIIVVVIVFVFVAIVVKVVLNKNNFLDQQRQTFWHIHGLIFKHKSINLTWVTIELTWNQITFFRFSTNVSNFELGWLLSHYDLSRTVDSRKSVQNATQNIYCIILLYLFVFYVKESWILSKMGKRYSI